MLSYRGRIVTLLVEKQIPAYGEDMSCLFWRVKRKLAYGGIAQASERHKPFMQQVMDMS